jgi:hypothetical protein
VQNGVNRHVLVAGALLADAECLTDGVGVRLCQASDRGLELVQVIFLEAVEAELKIELVVN